MSIALSLSPAARIESMDANMELVRCIPGAELAVIPNSGHATPIDAADEFNQTLLDFLSQLDVGS